MAVKPPRAEKPDYTFAKVMMAPIAGITDRSFRDIVRQKGCPLTFSELISARGITEKNPGTWRMLEECRGEENLVIQLFGNDPHYITEAVRMIADLGHLGINLNLGCPAKKVVKRGEGCGLTVFPTELVYVLRAMRKATPLHLSVKIRSGVDQNSLNYRMIGDIAQGEGCDALIFHARTRKMGFSGIANWDWIADMKEYLDIPVIGNGDVVDVSSAKRMLEETTCDGLMIGRGCYGNPWIFRDILHYMETGEVNEPPSLEDRFATIIDHMQLSVHYKGTRKGGLRNA